MRRLAACLTLLLLTGLVPLATPAAAATKTISGTISGTDGRAVSALIGFDLKDARGRTIAASGCVASASCPVKGYGMAKRINFDLGAEGSTDTRRWTTRWTAEVPSNTARVFLEVYPQGPRYTGTNHARYGKSYRRALPVPYGGPVHLRLPLVCGQGGSTGLVHGYATVGGRRQQLARVTTWSHAPESATLRPVLGWNIGTSAANGYWNLPDLVPGQPYQVIATAKDGRVKKYFNVRVSACRASHLTIAF